MRTIALLIVAALSLLPLAGSQVWAGQAADGLDIRFSLPVPKDQDFKAYLGLAPDLTTFTLDQVSADILIVEIFSMYCPICQREAQRVNDLYGMMQKEKGKKIRILGIGAGNSAYEVEFFKETYQIPFPVFSDADFTIHKKIGEQGTPFFIGIIPDRPEAERIFFTHSGDMKDLNEFFNRILESSDKP